MINNVSKETLAHLQTGEATACEMFAAASKTFQRSQDSWDELEALNYAAQANELHHKRLDTEVALYLNNFLA